LFSGFGNFIGGFFKDFAELVDSFGGLFSDGLDRFLNVFKFFFNFRFASSDFFFTGGKSSSVSCLGAGGFGRIRSDVGNNIKASFFDVFKLFFCFTKEFSEKKSSKNIRHTCKSIPISNVSLEIHLILYQMSI
jgi:hypothetical protein